MNEVYYSTGIPLGNATSVHHIHSKLSKAIRSMLDQILLQEDVNAILLWAKDNNMELNEEKFQLIQHGKISHLKPTTLTINMNPAQFFTKTSLIIHCLARPLF